MTLGNGNSIERKNDSNDSSGTFIYLDAGGEQDVVVIATTTRKIVLGIWLDLFNMTQNGTIKLYYKIDGSNYREFNSSDFTIATDSKGVYVNLNMGITYDLKVTYNEAVDEGDDRSIPYSIVYEEKE